MIRTNITEVHMSVREARDLANLMDEHGRTSLSRALDCAIANATERVGTSAHIGLVVDNVEAS